MAWARRNVDADGAAMGLQMLIAVIAALFLALLLRLEYPAWAVFTVLMLGMAQYVGAIQEKGLLRILGTIVGGALGFLATGALQQTQMLYLPLTFIVVAVSVAMFGQSRAPYAFFLSGLTYVVIISNSQVDPSQAWRYAILRIEEVSLGVVVSLIVQSTIFPRYANEAFQKVFNSALREIAQATPCGLERFREKNASLGATLRDFPEKSTALRRLMRFGGMESPMFRRDIGKHAEMVDRIGRAAALLRSLTQLDPAPEPYRTVLGSLMHDAGTMLGKGWGELEKGGVLASGWKADLDAVCEKIDEGLVALRSDTAAQSLSPAEVGTISAHLLTLTELRETLLGIDAWNQTPSQKIPRPESLALAPAWPDATWIFRATRAGLAVVVALVLENWLNPPGGSIMMLCVYTFTSLNALSPDESGDRFAFRQTIFFTIVMAAISLALLAGTPLLASYSVQNIVIGAWVFLFGYWLHRAGGVTVPLTVSFMALVSMVGLNAQRPVAFEGIVGFFFGIANGFVIASLAQRLLWPALPQKNLQKGMQSYLETLAVSLPDGIAKLPLWKRTNHVLFPSKARLLIRVMRGPTLPVDEAERLEEYVLTVQEIGASLSLCVGYLLPILPPDLAKIGSAAVDDAKETMRRGLDELSRAFGDARMPCDLAPTINAALTRWDEWCETLHHWVLEKNTSPQLSVPLLGFSARFRISLVLLRRAFDEGRGLRLADYLGDISV